MTTRVEWEAAVAAGSYRRSTRGASLEEVGFIHLSDSEQLPRVADFLYRDVLDPLVVLELESEEVETTGARLVWEDGGAGEEFPHLYGPIELPTVLRFGLQVSGQMAAWSGGWDLTARRFRRAGGT